MLLEAEAGPFWGSPAGQIGPPPVFNRRPKKSARLLQADNNDWVPKRNVDTTQSRGLPSPRVHSLPHQPGRHSPRSLDFHRLEGHSKPGKIFFPKFFGNTSEWGVGLTEKEIADRKHHVMEPEDEEVYIADLPRLDYYVDRQDPESSPWSPVPFSRGDLPIPKELPRPKDLPPRPLGVLPLRQDGNDNREIGFGSDVNGWVEIEHKDVHAGFPRTVQSMKPIQEERVPVFVGREGEDEDEVESKELPFYISLGVQKELEGTERTRLPRKPGASVGQTNAEENNVQRWQIHKTEENYIVPKKDREHSSPFTVFNREGGEARPSLT